jgi:bifunctional DNA-binding transcriptional regulator/antitoxin component of YhaV-PrlF toxin-antitoxin module
VPTLVTYLKNGHAGGDQPRSNVAALASVHETRRAGKKSTRLVMRIKPNGDAPLPAEIREKAGLLPDTEFEVELNGTDVVIRRAQTAPSGDDIVRRLRSLKGDRSLTTDETMRMTRGEDE